MHATTYKYMIPLYCSTRQAPPNMPARKRPQKNEPVPPKQDVREKQDAAHTEGDFLRDLDKASTDRAKERLKKPEEP
jgi:hypothetical protein